MLQPDTSSPSQSSPSSPSKNAPPKGAGVPAKAVIRRQVLIGSGVTIIAIALWAILAPVQAGEIIGALLVWISETFGWYFVLTAAVVVTFVLYLAFSKMGQRKLGPDHAKPQFNLFTWASMLFAAGIGIDLLFFAVAEPVSQYMHPPTGDGATVEAARQAIVWTFFHYGPVGWAMYALMGGAFAYFAYRRNLPLNIRSLLVPIFGNRVNGALGHTVDIMAVLGTIFGISVTLGIGVVQLSYGMHVLFGTPDNLAMQIALIVLSVLMATISTVTGVEKGIRRLSELNVLLAIALLLWILITGETRTLFEGLVMNVGDFVARFPHMIMETFAWDQPDEWMQGWTIFFWAWWVAWAPFVGLFLARISRGRSLRQFIFGVMVIPFAFIAIFISILGNSALAVVLGGDTEFGETVISVPEQGFFTLMQQYPAAPLVVGLALLTGLLFYVTSADSGALVLANLSSKIEDPKQDADKRLRVFWAVATGLLTLGMLLVGGVPTLQQATVIIGLPVSLLLYLVMVSLFRALKDESQHQEGYTATMPLRFGHTEISWRKRLRQATTFPDAQDAAKYVDAVVEPALEEVSKELAETGVSCAVERTHTTNAQIASWLLRVRFENQQDFTYQVYPVAHEIPVFATGKNMDMSTYYRLEVFTGSGSHGYNVYGYSYDRLIADVLGHFESHLEYLRISDGRTDAAVAEEATRVTDWGDDFRDPADGTTATAEPK